MTDTASTSTESTREHLMDVAEGLFLDNGIDNVSLRAIVKASGQRNQSALQYHFGGREGLIAAITQRRVEQLERRRERLIAAVQQDQVLQLRDVVAIQTGAPFLLCREQAEFRHFLGQFGQRLLASDRQISFILEEEQQHSPTLMRVREVALTTLGKLPRDLRTLRMENAYGTALLAISRRARSGEPFRGRKADLFLANLVDQVTAMLCAPISREARAHLPDD